MADGRKDGKYPFLLTENQYLLPMQHPVVMMSIQGMAMN